MNGADGKLIAAAGTTVDEALAAKIETLGTKEIPITPWVSTEVDYLTADDEEQYVIAQANVPLDPEGHFLATSCLGPPQRRLRAGVHPSGGLHGRLAEADRQRRRRHDPVPGA